MRVEFILTEYEQRQAVWKMAELNNFNPFSLTLDDTLPFLAQYFQSFFPDHIAEISKSYNSCGMTTFMIDLFEVIRTPECLDIVKKINR